jgi:hypothetical protein
MVGISLDERACERARVQHRPSRYNGGAYVRTMPDGTRRPLPLARCLSVDRTTGSTTHQASSGRRDSSPRRPCGVYLPSYWQIPNDIELGTGVHVCVMEPQEFATPSWQIRRHKPD